MNFALSSKSSHPLDAACRAEICIYTIHKFTARLSIMRLHGCAVTYHVRSYLARVRTISPFAQIKRDTRCRCANREMDCHISEQGSLQKVAKSEQTFISRHVKYWLYVKKTEMRNESKSTEEYNCEKINFFTNWTRLWPSRTARRFLQRRGSWFSEFVNKFATNELRNAYGRTLVCLPREFSGATVGDFKRQRARYWFSEIGEVSCKIEKC